MAPKRYFRHAMGIRPGAGRAPWPRRWHARVVTLTTGLAGLLRYNCDAAEPGV